MTLSDSVQGITAPFYVDDRDALREKLARAERDGTRMGQVWASLRRRARSAPEQFPWFTPFVALVTGEESDIEAARQAIRHYVGTFDAISYSMGVQFHFWCFAFPHARWSLYFQWLQSMGAWEAEEEARLREALLTFQYDNFFYGMRTKPEPECVDNQTMSLCYSNALLGYLFGRGEHASAMAQRMYEDGMRRLPSMIGGMPAGGYSGEGSTYMDYVVGPCIPFLTEFLERAEGGDWFTRTLPPNGGAPETIVRMIAREWMPNGLLLPWDHYGYSHPVRSCIAYGAHRTHDPLFTELLEQHAGWSHDISIGWGYDDLVWTLIWWPGAQAESSRSAFASWQAPDVGGALVSENADLYLMQMWDHTEPGYPTRAHVNPNAVTLAAYGSPLTTDGVPSKACTAFNFEDTWREISNMNFTPVKTNFGVGCAGAHSVLLVDGWEGMRAYTEYHPQASELEFSGEHQVIAGDVTPLYREHWADVRMMRRRSRLCDERFWLIEDLAAFTQEHDVTARWFFRPQQVATPRGVLLETAEGVRLHLLPLLGPDERTSRSITGYPDRLDGESLQVDFTQRGKECRWLWLAWPEATRAVANDLSDDWQLLADPDGALDVDTARRQLTDSTLRLPFTMPAFMLADLPVARRWWYRKVVLAPTNGPCWLRLPRQMHDPRVWVNGVEIDLAPYRLRMELLAPQIPLPQVNKGCLLQIIVRCDCSTGQYGAENYEGTSFAGHPALLVPTATDGLIDAQYRDGVVTVASETAIWQVEHALMEGE